MRFACVALGGVTPTNDLSRAQNCRTTTVVFHESSFVVFIVLVIVMILYARVMINRSILDGGWTGSEQIADNLLAYVNRAPSYYRRGSHTINNDVCLSCCTCCARVPALVFSGAPSRRWVAC